MKICNDLRWMNSGPLTGLSDIELEAIPEGIDMSAPGLTQTPIWCTTVQRAHGSHWATKRNGQAKI